MKRRSFFGYACLFLASCSATRQNATDNGKAAIADLPNPLTFTVTDATGLEELKEDYDPFRQALAEVLGTDVEFLVVDSPVAAAPTMLAGKLDLAWAGPSEYLILQARAKGVPLVSLQRPDFRGAIVVRADSGIQSLTDLKGKTIDMYKIGSTSTHLGVTQLLMEAGLNPQTDFKTVMLGEHSLQALKNGKVDAVGRTTHRYKSVTEAENLSPGDYPIIGTTPLLPGDIFVASSQLETEVIETMRSRMLENQDRLVAGILATPGLAKKFKDSSLTPVEIEDYEAVREVYRAIGQEHLIQ